MRTRLNSLPLFWRVFGTNAAVLVLAFLALVFAPVTVSVPPTAIELAVLAVGLACLLALNLGMLRPAFRPLDELVETMRGHDPLSPGKRVRVSGGPAVAALAQTFNEMLDRLESERRDSARRALLVQEGERQRIARELHDEVGQTLTGVMLQVEGLAGRIPDELQDQLDELRETARHGTEEVRRIARRLRPEALEDLGLESALAALAAAIGEQAELRIERRLEPALPLSQEQELVVYRIAQEALTNVARHADATEVQLHLAQANQHVVLTVRDDGGGLPPGAFRSSQGIRGMRERAMLIGAQLTIGEPAAGGTEVQLSHPCRTENRMTTPLTTHILIADDHPIVLRGLRMVLDAQPDLAVVAEATDGDQAVERALSDEIHLAILDISMPRKTGLQAAREITHRKPEVRVLMLSMHDNEQYLFEAIRAGASGYVLKSAVDRDLVEACRAAMRGEPFLYPGAVRALMREYLDRARAGEALHKELLTPREEEIVKLVAEAHTNEEIGEMLFISKKTVERHRANILEKLGMRDRVELTRYAIRRGLVQP